MIVRINSKQEVATWKAWDYLAKIITNHKLPQVQPMLTLPNVSLNRDLHVKYLYPLIVKGNKVPMILRYNIPL